MYGIMKFKKYIKEINDDDFTDSIAKRLKKDCMPFIKEMKSNNLYNWFYRATEHHYKDISKIKPRKNRRPRNMPLEIHKYMDKVFKKKFGWNVRSEGVFVSSDRNQLEYIYGDTYLFFPIGNYKYVYHPWVKDIFMKFDGEYDLDPKRISDETIKKVKEGFHEIVPQYTNKNLGISYSNIVEVAFKCKSYYMVNEKFVDELKKELKW